MGAAARARGVCVVRSGRPSRPPPAAPHAPVPSWGRLQRGPVRVTPSQRAREPPRRGSGPPALPASFLRSRRRVPVCPRVRRLEKQSVTTGRLQPQTPICPRFLPDLSPSWRLMPETQVRAGPVPPAAALLGVGTPLPPHVLMWSLCVICVPVSSYQDAVLWGHGHLPAPASPLSRAVCTSRSPGSEVLEIGTST